MTRLLLNRLRLTRLLLNRLHDSVPFIVAFVPNDGSDVLADSNLELLLFSTRTAAIISDVRLVKKLLLLLMLIGLLIAGIVQVIPHSKTTQLLNDAWPIEEGAREYINDSSNEVLFIGLFSIMVDWNCC